MKKLRGTKGFIHLALSTTFVPIMIIVGVSVSLINTGTYPQETLNNVTEYENSIQLDETQENKIEERKNRR